MEPWQSSASELVELVRTRQLSPVELVQSLLDRIEKIDPELQAWVTVDTEGALTSARELVKRQMSAEPLGRLAGLPLGLKDVIHAKGLRTTASSAALQDFVPDEDATAVALFKHEDGVILGKVYTAEFACADPAPTRNPWRDGHTPGGSSSGSAAAVAAGMVPVSLGTQTGGSTLRPAAYNGIVGVKPTYGLVSNHGVIALSWSFDHVGVLARSVADADLVLGSIAGYDSLDPASRKDESSGYASNHLQRSGAPVIGVAHSYFLQTCEPEVLQNVEQTIERLEDAGAQIREIALPASFPRIAETYPDIALAETAAYHADRFAKRGSLYGPKIADIVRQGSVASATDYVRAMRLRPQLTADLEGMLAGCDALLTPTTPAPAPRNMSSTGDPSYLIPFSYAGLPAVSLPSGVNAWGLPLGVQLVGHRWRDRNLLGAAEWCERVIEFSLHPPCW